jgi:sarcosine oxidase
VRVAVVGAGVVGLSTTAALCAAGADAVCFERSGTLMGERSAGSSRIFRLAHADPALVRLAVAARGGFARWAEQAGRPMVERVGCVVSGGDAAERAAAMEAADVPFALVEPGSERLRLPGAVTASPVLVDPEGGVVDVDAVRTFLTARAGSVVVHEPVDILDGTTVRTRSGSQRFDAVVLAAGSGTAALAAQVGLDVPAELEHHVRFTFPVEDGPWQAWIDAPEHGLATYQHRSGPGRWSVGGSVDPALVAWDVGGDAAAEASREVVLAHVRERLAVEPRVVGSLYCTHVPGTGDGIAFARAGGVLAVHGENLMKFAPVLGELTAAAAWDGSTPDVSAA